jgi:hypothetical protein
MATIFLPAKPPRSLFRVMMLKAGRWEPWTNYATYASGRKVRHSSDAFGSELLPDVSDFPQHKGGAYVH